MLNPKPDYFIQIPPEVLFEPKLSAGAKLFYGEVLFLTYTYGFCSQKNAYFAANQNQNLIKVELIRKQNQEVELRKIFALIKIDFSKMPGANQRAEPAETSPPSVRVKSAQQKRSYGVNQNVFLSDNEMEELQKKYQKEQIEKAIENYSDWNFERISNTCKIMLKLADFEMNYLNWLSNWIKENNYELPKFDVDLGSDKTKKRSLEQFPLYTYRDYYIDQEKKQNKDWANYTIKSCK